MNKVTVTFCSHIHHLCQIAAGFLLLREQGWQVELVDASRDTASPFYDLHFAFAEYKGVRIAYDVCDGYPVPLMEKALEMADIYFKRSFSSEKNQKYFPLEQQKKIHPLGFNYHVTLPNSPLNEPLWKHLAKPLFGRAPDRYFTPGVFEGKASYTGERPPKILFLTRLWQEEPELDEATNAERREINRNRIALLHGLKEQYGDSFIGGLNDLPVARELAPELILPAKYTERKRYMQILHSCDICIGTMGLHESVGWKTGEYVAAAKAIVNERFHYQAPGNFREGTHYLPFDTYQECLAAVRQLVDDPDACCAMQRANADYYEHFLKPQVLIGNTLAFVENSLANSEKNP